MKISVEGTGKAISVFAGNFGTTAIVIEESTELGARLLSIDLDRATAITVATAIQEIAKRKS
jgi:hypothetical protein